MRTRVRVTGMAIPAGRRQTTETKKRKIWLNHGAEGGHNATVA